MTDRQTDQDAEADNASKVPEGFVGFLLDRGFAAHNGPFYWKLTKERAELGFRVLPHHLNPGGICHGAILMGVTDIAIGLGVTWQKRMTKFPPSISNSYDFMAPSFEGDWLETETTILNVTKRMGFSQGLLIGPRGPVLRYSGTIKLPSETDTRFDNPEFLEVMKTAFDRFDR